MRRFLFGVVIASVTAAMPAWAFGGDREIAKTVMTELQEHKAAGELKGFDIDLKVENGVVYLTGTVASAGQKTMVADAAANAVGSSNVVNKLRVEGETAPELNATKTPAAQPVVKAVAAPQMTSQSPVRTASTTEKQTQPSAQDMRVTDAIIGKLQQSKAAGMLRGFELDVSTVGGDVWLRGKVADQVQKSHVLDVARRTRGANRVIDDVTVTQESVIRQASTGGLTPVPPQASMPATQVSSMPVAGGSPMPQAFAPSGLASASMGGGYVPGTPVAMNGAAAQYGAGAPRYDQPNMPSYAWPSYAAHPNYAAVTYPKQYSPSAWPYIGPFYPYPQVPLGWRKVSLEWDDGLWYLDFTSK